MVKLKIIILLFWLWTPLVSPLHSQLEVNSGIIAHWTFNKDFDENITREEISGLSDTIEGYFQYADSGDCR